MKNVLTQKLTNTFNCDAQSCPHQSTVCFSVIIEESVLLTLRLERDEAISTNFV